MAQHITNKVLHIHSDVLGFRSFESFSPAGAPMITAAQLRAAFANDLKLCQQRTYDEWVHRSLWHKFIDQLAYLGSSQL